MLDGIVVLNNPVNWVDPWGLDRWPAPGAPDTVGRPGTVVPSGGRLGTFIQDHVGSGWEFGNNHDQLVGTVTDWGVPDPIINIPSMLPVYLYSIASDMCEMSPEERPDYFPLIEIRW